MFSKNLKYYRLKNNLSKKELANKVSLTPMAITNYENGERMPSMEIIKSLAQVLNIRVSDFLDRRNDDLRFVHGKFRKNSQLTVHEQNFVRESVEEYMNRFYSIIQILGDKVLPEVPFVSPIELSNDIEEDARKLRQYLGLGSRGPIGNLIEIVENNGILVFLLEENYEHFSGMNGRVNDRPYIILKKNMSPERMRSTLVHELAHLFFIFDGCDDKEIENTATAIAGAFLFPYEDVIRELGIRRTRITKDMKNVCKEYGISMYLLVKRASLCHVISEYIEKDFYIQANKAGWRKNEPSRIEKEQPYLFSQLVYRAICENEISIQKGAELLQQPYAYVQEQCFGDEV